MIIADDEFPFNDAEYGAGDQVVLPAGWEIVAEGKNRLGQPYFDLQYVENLGEDNEKVFTVRIPAHLEE